MILQELDKLKHESRPYQIEAFENFVKCYQEHNQSYIDVVFNMATGSGKTHMMAGLMLYLNSLGYNTFVFFVHATSILAKTKANFIYSEEMKSQYLFKTDININEIKNLNDSKDGRINMMFVTVQRLHLQFLKYKDKLELWLKSNKIVLFADEAHHLNKTTLESIRKGSGGLYIDNIGTSWERTVATILHMNTQNILLQFSATVNVDNNIKLTEKFKDKFISKYDFTKFHLDKYSKNIGIFTIDANDDVEFRNILFACLMNEYRRLIASDNNLEIKPIILVRHNRKASTISAKESFIRNLKVLDIPTINSIIRISNNNNRYLKSAIDYLFTKFSTEYIINMLKVSFCEENIYITTDNNKNDHILQNLHNNNLRIIFDCKRLTEGWDVLNLYDIVVLHDITNSQAITQDAQLIGRGARYNPFNYGEHDFYKRKFDNTNHPLAIMETMFFYASNKPKYIERFESELNKSNIIYDKYGNLKFSNIDRTVDIIYNYDEYQEYQELFAEYGEQFEGIDLPLYFSYVKHLNNNKYKIKYKLDKDFKNNRAKHLSVKVLGYIGKIKVGCYFDGKDVYFIKVLSQSDPNEDSILEGKFRFWLFDKFFKSVQLPILAMHSY